jgi:Domain of unknown function (DUF4258)
VSDTLEVIKALVASGAFSESVHASAVLSKRGISLSDVLSSLPGAAVVEDYPQHWLGPSILALHTFSSGMRCHVLWGTSRTRPGHAVLVTVYVPDPKQWSENLLTRLKRPQAPSKS